ATVTIKVNDKEVECSGKGNGRFDAVSNAIKEELKVDFTDLTYKEHALTIGSSSQAISYVGFRGEDGEIYWGSGIDSDIIESSVKGLFSAVNKMLANKVTA